MTITLYQAANNNLRDVKGFASIKSDASPSKGDYVFVNDEQYEVKFVVFKNDAIAVVVAPLSSQQRIGGI